jgi:hypothetical protein
MGVIIIKEGGSKKCPFLSYPFFKFSTYWFAPKMPIFLTFKVQYLSFIDVVNCVLGVNFLQCLSRGLFLHITLISTN